MAGIKTKNKELLILTERCKGCGFCVEFCPQHLLMMHKQTNAKGYNPVYLIDGEKCSKCNMCGMVCPDFAITVVEVSETRSKG